MARRMSCSLTVPAVRDRSKTVTRRHVDTWRDLKPGDRVTLVEKAMGLPKGARQVVLAEVEIVDVRVEPILAVLDELGAPAREGLPDMSSDGFISFWLRSHGYREASSAGWVWLGGALERLDMVRCRRIEWRYLPRVKASLRTVDDHGNVYTALAFVCPGCALMPGGGSGLHMLPVNSPNKAPQWEWNGDLERPTLSPSILTRGAEHHEPALSRHVCHSFLRDGVFEFLGDCTHPLVGQRVPLPDLPDWVVSHEEVGRG